MKKSFLAVTFGLLTVLVAAAGYTMQRTSQTEFCLSCHEMERQQFELKRSGHAMDKDKNPISCAQCHIPLTPGPRYLAVKSYSGIKDVAVHLFGDPGELDRRALQHVARRFVQDENCLACHQDLGKTVKNQPIGPEGKKAHEGWLEKDGIGRRTCASCHHNMAHLPVFDRRYAVNAAFAEKLPLQEE
jgi:nitrate/TMAO reductase-like tetraheme cytochrome c subunit